jgi:hypothetical protein
MQEKEQLFFEGKTNIPEPQLSHFLTFSLMTGIFFVFY